MKKKEVKLKVAKEGKWKKEKNCQNCDLGNFKKLGGRAKNTAGEVKIPEFSKIKGFGNCISTSYLRRQKIHF